MHKRIPAGISVLNNRNQGAQIIMIVFSLNKTVLPIAAANCYGYAFPVSYFKSPKFCV